MLPVVLNLLDIIAISWWLVAVFYLCVALFIKFCKVTVTFKTVGLEKKTRVKAVKRKTRKNNLQCKKLKEGKEGKYKPGS